MLSASPKDLFIEDLDVAVMTPLATVISNLDVTSTPVTLSYALMSAVLTVNLSASYVSEIPTAWMLFLSVKFLVSNHTW